MKKIIRTIGGTHGIEVEGKFVGRLEHVQYPGYSISYFQFMSADVPFVTIGFRSIADFYQYAQDHL